MSLSKRPSSQGSVPSIVQSRDSNGSNIRVSQLPTNSSKEFPMSSTLLQDRIREKKAQGAETGKSDTTTSKETFAYGRDDGIFDDDNTNFEYVDGRLVQSSPMGPSQIRNHSLIKGKLPSRLSSLDERTRNITGKELHEVRKPLDIRRMNHANLQAQLLSKLHKENFNLKLEISYRREEKIRLERQLKKELDKQLDKQLEKIPVLETENAELQEVNEQLLSELEKRDQAVEEAVGIICELEEKKERLEHKVQGLQDRLADTRPSTAQPDTECFTTDAEDNMPPSSPPELRTPQTNPPAQSALLKQTNIQTGKSTVASSHQVDLAMPETSKPPHRTPSFLTSQNASHNALRSLYQTSEKGKASFVAPSIHDSIISDASSDSGLDYMNSPHLSVVSESSFVSVYGKKPQNSITSPVETERKDQADRYIVFPQESTIERPKQTNMARVNDWIGEKVTNPETGPKLARASSQRKHISHTEKFIQPDFESPTKQPSIQEVSQRKELVYSDIKQRPQRRPLEPAHSSSYSVHDGLPPTPDTMSTFEKLPSVNHSASSIIAEKSLLDGITTPARSFSALKPERTSQNIHSTETPISEDDHHSEYDEEIDSSLAPIFPSPTIDIFANPTNKTSEPSLLGRDFIFNGAEISPPRRFRPANERSVSMQHAQSFSNNPRSHLNRMETAPLSPNEWRSSSGTEMPLKQRYIRSHADSPSTNRTTPPNSAPLQHEENQQSNNHKQEHQQRQSSLPVAQTRHARPATAAAIPETPQATPQAPTTNKKPSLTSRLFRRSNSHALESPVQQPGERLLAQQARTGNEGQRGPRPPSTYAEGLHGTRTLKPGATESAGVAKAAEGDTDGAKAKWNLAVSGMGLGRSSSLRERGGVGKRGKEGARQ